MTDVRVNTWTELQDELFEGSWNEGIGRVKTTLSQKPTLSPGSFSLTNPLEF